MQQSDPSQCYKLYKYIVYYWIFIAAAFLRGETIQNFIYIYIQYILLGKYVTIAYYYYYYYIFFCSVCKILT